MKKITILLFMFLLTKSIIAQDQTVNGLLTLNPQSSGSYLQGLRIKEAPDKWSLALFGAVGNTGTSTDSWLVGRSPKLNFVISRNSANGLNGLVINQAGNIGLGTESPKSKLDVFGNMKLTIPRSSSPIEGVDIFAESFSTSENAKNSYYLKLRDIGAGATVPDVLVVKGNRNIGIGVSEPTQRLDVAGNIKANGAYINGIVYTNEVKVEATTWADFVFDKDYKLPALSEVENHISEHKHLPNIPSEAEVKENGISLGEMQAKLLQKIEELTLYVIDLKKENTELGKKIEELQSKQEGNN